MTTPIDFIREQRDKAQHDYDDALKRLKTWTEALSLLEPEETGSEENNQTEQKGTELTIGDYVKQVLQERGPLRCVHIQRRVVEKGRETSVNSINVHLNRYKGKRYSKGGDGKWRLISKGKGGRLSVQPMQSNLLGE